MGCVTFGRICLVSSLRNDAVGNELWAPHPAVGDCSIRNPNPLHFVERRKNLHLIERQPRANCAVLAHTVDHLAAEFLYPSQNRRRDVSSHVHQHPPCAVLLPTDVLFWSLGWCVAGFQFHRQPVVGDPGGDLVALHHLPRIEEPGVDLALNGVAVRLVRHECLDLAHGCQRQIGGVQQRTACIPCEIGHVVTRNTGHRINVDGTPRSPHDRVQAFRCPFDPGIPFVETPPAVGLDRLAALLQRSPDPETGKRTIGHRQCQNRQRLVVPTLRHPRQDREEHVAVHTRGPVRIGRNARPGDLRLVGEVPHVVCGSAT